MKHATQKLTRHTTKKGYETNNTKISAIILDAGLGVVLDAGLGVVLDAGLGVSLDVVVGRPATSFS